MQLDTLNPQDPTHTWRDYDHGEARSTTALRICQDAFKAFQSNDTPQTRNNLTIARLRFRMMCKAQEA